MIELKNIFTEISENKIYLKATCAIDGEEQTLWYSTAIENKRYITTSNADSFLIVLFIYSVFNNKRLKSNVAISSELRYGLLEVLLPSFKQLGYKTDKSDFDFPEIDYSVFPETQAIGTAMSFGIDSFYTFIDSQNSQKKINTITLFNSGAFGQYGGEKADSLFEAMKKKVASFTEETNKDFIWVDTNTNEILRMSFFKSFTFRNFACVFVLQKLFKNYIYSSSYTLLDFELNKESISLYDLLTITAVRGNSLNFHISGLNENRVEKTIRLSDEPLVQKYLNVCLITPDNANVQTDKNCSKCYKCIRTMLTLDAIGKLENFKDVFDLEIFRSNKAKYIGNSIYRSRIMKDVHEEQFLDEMNLRNYAIPSKAYWYFILRATKAAKNKLIKNG